MKHMDANICAFTDCKKFNYPTGGTPKSIPLLIWLSLSQKQRKITNLFD